MRCCTRSHGDTMEQYITKGGKRLRLGYTTGSCAAAAAKAAAWMLLTGRRKEKITLMTPKGLLLELCVREIRMQEGCVSCAIEKDGGDDPDITNGTLVFAQVTPIDSGICIDGGEGVGRVTRCGLDQPVGAAAINSVPRRMIQENVEEVCRLTDYTGGLHIQISVPQGEQLARKTFNPRLGIQGGISILGTTGIVEPMSEKALVDTIRVELRQRKASGWEYVLLTPGNYGAEYIRTGLQLDPDTAVQSSNFIGDTLDLCQEFGFKGALLVGHIGKLVKIAGGMLNTHSQYGDCRMEILAAHAAACGLSADSVNEVLGCVSCDAALDILQRQQLLRPVMDRIARQVEQHLLHRSAPMEVGAILFSKEYGLLAKTQQAEQLLLKIRKE